MTDRILSDIFVVPPISVLDVKQKYWKKRKKYWLDRISDSSVGRDPALLSMSPLMQKKHKNTSVFDPVLTEIMYLWFTAESDVVYDPFAGGSVRGEICQALNRQYIGVDVREEQILANENVLPTATWILGSSSEYTPELPIDFLFTCPPYLWLEKYSDQQNDLSTLSEVDFYKMYAKALCRGLSVLSEDRFAAIVVGNVRRDDGSYSNLVGETIEIFESCGMKFYNDLILLQEPASASMRAFNFMNASRKVAKNHQNVLVFLKGDASRATARLLPFVDTGTTTFSSLFSLCEE